MTSATRLSLLEDESPIPRVGGLDCAATGSAAAPKSNRATRVTRKILVKDFWGIASPLDQTLRPCEEDNSGCPVGQACPPGSCGREGQGSRAAYIANATRYQ